MSEMKILSPLRRWHVLAGLCAESKAQHLVEVGCKEGRTTGFLLAELPNLKVTAVDPWCDLPNAGESYQQWDWQKIIDEFYGHIGPNADRCAMLRMTSVAASRQIPDASADIVFIDAGHDFDNAFCDIKTWWPKVREGGYLCGHDYQHTFPGVHRAVARCFPLLRVAVMPDSVWCVQKDASLRIAA